jgi:predicted short-subunit dehydrogenase-like oxidoreductase (DUF2520 family)
MNQSASFVSIGAGNVATQLVSKFCHSGFRLIQVYSRTEVSANALAKLHNVVYTTSTSEINANADFYLVSIPDQALPLILDQIKIHDKLIFHTAGSHGLEVFGKEFSCYGVMYPLQTFSKNVKLDLSKVPFLIEASDDKTLLEIEKIASLVSDKVYKSDSETRRWIHMAAVFACNFSNHMIVLSDEILNQKKLDTSILRPLIEETFRKSISMDPYEAQTGPAVRDDFSTLDIHIKMLDNQALLQKIYTFTSQSIQFTKSSKQKKSGK